MDSASSKLNSGDRSPKRPWSYIQILAASVLFGLPGAYLIVWQNLKRIGKEDVAKKFLIVGGIIVLLIMTILIFLPVSRTISRGLSNGLAIMFPIWLYLSYLREWQKQNPKGAGFSWSLLGWGLLGLVLYLAIAFIIGFISAWFSGE